MDPMRHQLAFAGKAGAATRIASSFNCAVIELRAFLAERQTVRGVERCARDWNTIAGRAIAFGQEQCVGPGS